MKCPYCGEQENKVTDSREAKDGTEIRRRRECLGCERRFTSYERVDDVTATVVKRDGSRERFDREKLLTGLLRACEKRPVPRKDLIALVDGVEYKVATCENKEMSSKEIGNCVISELRYLDQVAYVRFASVYRRFEDVNQFVEELRELLLNRDDHR